MSDTPRSNERSGADPAAADSPTCRGGTDGAWGSCSAEPYWLEVAEALDIDPESTRETHSS